MKKTIVKIDENYINIFPVINQLWYNESANDLLTYFSFRRTTMIILCIAFAPCKVY